MEQSKKNVFINIPIYIANDLHLDFTLQTLRSIKESVQNFHNQYVVVTVNYLVPNLAKSSIQSLSGLIKYILYNDTNSVAGAWNMGIKHALATKDFEVDYVLTCNNDIILHPNAIDNLVKFANSDKNFIMWSAAEHSNLRTLKTVELTNSVDDHPHFSCFMINPFDFIAKLKEKEKDNGEPFPGYFDETFTPAYLEDNDMHNRVLRAGFRAGITSAALFYHYGSRTIKTDEDLYASNLSTHNKNRTYFKRKWGFDVDGIGIANDDPVRYKFVKPYGSK